MKFSIEYQRRTRKSKSYAVTLTKVPGIGPKKAESLMRRFKTVANIRNAEMGQLIEAEGISYKDARNIYEFFHDEEGNLIL